MTFGGILFQALGDPWAGPARGETLPGGTLRLRLGDLEVFRDREQWAPPGPGARFQRSRRSQVPNVRGSGEHGATVQLSDDSERLGYSSAK